MLRVNRVPRPARERDPRVTQLHEIIRDHDARTTVVATNERHAGEGFVGRDEHRGKLRLDRAADQPAIPPLRFRDDQSVDAPLPNPFEDNRWIIVAGQLRAGEHQAGVTLGQLRLDASEQPRKPRVLARVDDDANATVTAEAQVSCG